MADPDEALIEAIEGAIDNATDAPFCPHDGLEHTCHCNTCAARAAYAAMVAHLGLVEETQRGGYDDYGWMPEHWLHEDELTHRRTRLVSRWTEVDQ